MDEPLRVPVHRLDDNTSDFIKLSVMRGVIERSQNKNIILDFTECSFLRHPAVAFIGGLIRHAASLGKTVTIDWPTVRQHVRNNLAQNGFASMFGDTDAIGPWRGNSIPYREDHLEDGPAVMEYLQTSWLGRKWVNVSDELASAIQGKVWEIYANCFEHSRSKVGVFTCGQHYPNEKRLGLCVIDFGVGIPHKVRSFLRKPHLRPEEALKWAFRSGTSTSSDKRKGRGIGLNLLKEFVELNDGQLSIYSDGGHARVTGGGEVFRRVSSPFQGTIVDIRFICDEDRYALASEVVPPEPLF